MDWWLVLIIAVALGIAPGYLAIALGPESRRVIRSGGIGLVIRETKGKSRGEYPGGDRARLQKVRPGVAAILSSGGLSLVMHHVENADAAPDWART